MCLSVKLEKYINWILSPNSIFTKIIAFPYSILEKCKPAITKHGSFEDFSDIIHVPNFTHTHTHTHTEVFTNALTCVPYYTQVKTHVCILIDTLTSIHRKIHSYFKQIHKQKKLRMQIYTRTDYHESRNHANIYTGLILFKHIYRYVR